MEDFISACYLEASSQLCFRSCSYFVKHRRGGSDAGLRPFRFEAFWATDKRSFRVVKEAWKLGCRGSPGFILCDKIKKTRLALKFWNREEFGSI